MIFGKKIRKQVKKFALENPKEEICGVIFYNGIELSAKQCLNISECKNKNFILSPKDFLKYSLLGEIVGIFHSHTEGTTNASLPDIINLNGHNIKLLIYSIKEDSFQEHEPNNYISPYIGREFIWGKQDCLTLVADYYQNEKNLNIKEYFSDRNAQIFDTIKHGWNFNDNIEIYKKLGFKKICNNLTDNIELQKNDLLLIQKKDATFATHGAIYIGGNRILHQPRDSFSLIEELNYNTISKVVEVLRLC
jgi:proteasome lid subunit RPN8/RPN11